MRVVAKGTVGPGAAVVLASDRGLMDGYGWNPESSEPVTDLSMVNHGVPLDDGALGRLGMAPISGLVDRAMGLGDDAADIDEADQSAALEEIRTRLSEATPPAWKVSEWQDLVVRLGRGRIVKARNEVPWLVLPELESKPEPRSVELDETSLADGVVRLDRHGEAVGQRAASVARRLGVTAEIAEILRRTGQLHDIGKGDWRFQRWLDPDAQHGFPLAKSTTPRHLWDRSRVAAGWPRGGRHEALSARLAQRWLECRGVSKKSFFDDLLVHLVISHHGSGRPLVRPVLDGTPALVSGAIEGDPVQSSADLSVTDWEQPARFLSLSEIFGHWGLALLEAIIRQSDHAVSGGLHAE